MPPEGGFMFELDGVPQAFAVILPNVHEITADLGGRLFPSASRASSRGSESTPLRPGDLRYLASVAPYIARPLAARSFWLSSRKSVGATYRVRLDTSNSAGFWRTISLCAGQSNFPARASTRCIASMQKISRLDSRARNTLCSHDIGEALLRRSRMMAL